MASPYDNIIDDLAKNDPEFLKLAPDQQDSLVMSLAQEKYGNIPKTEQVLSSANAKIKPFYSGSDTPKVAFQGIQGFMQNAPQNIVENPISTAIGGPSLAQMKGGAQAIGGIQSLLGREPSFKPETTEISDKYMNPESTGGKALGGILNFASGLYNPLKLVGPSIMKGASKAIDPINPMSTMKRQTELPGNYSKSMMTLKDMQRADLEHLDPKINRAKSVYDVIKGKMSTKSSEAKIKAPEMNKQELDSLLYTGKKDIGTKSKILAEEYSNKFGEGLLQLDSSMTKGNFSDIIDNAIERLGYETMDIPGTPANKLKAFRDKVVPFDKDGNVTVDLNEIMDAKTFQSAHKSIMKMLGPDVNARIKYNQSVLSNLPESIPGLDKLKAEYAPKFETMRGVKTELTSGALGKVAKGEAAPERIQSMKKYASEIKSDVVDRAEQFSAKYKTAKEAAENTAKELGLKADEAKQYGEKTLAQIGKYLDSLGDKKKEILNKHKNELEDLANLFRETREELSKEKIEKYKRLAIIASLSSLAGLSGVRKVLKEKF